MVLRIVSTFCLIITFIIISTCDFFRSSRRGLILTHWMIVLYLTSDNWNEFKYGNLPSISGLELLLPLSTIYIILDHLSTNSSPSEHLCLLSRILFIFFLLAIDLICLILSLELRYEASLVMLSLFIFTGVLLFTSTPLKYQSTIQGMYDYSTDDLFSNYSNLPKCMGNYGKYLYFSIFAQLLRQIIPSLRLSILFTYITYISLTVCTLGFLTIPAYLGGLINAIKILGAKLTEKCNSNNLRVQNDIFD